MEMNRREKRKDKKNRKLYKEVASNDTEFNSMLKIMGVLLVVFFTVYIAYAIYNGDFAAKQKETDPEVEFQDVFILAGTTFNMNKEEYYVMYYDRKDHNAAAIAALYDGYVGTSNEVKLYLVDLSNKFNATYILGKDEQLNKTPKDISELKVQNPTLVMINNKKTTFFITGMDDVSKYIIDIVEKSREE